MIDEETGLLKGWNAVEGLDGTKRYYPKGKENNLDFELSEEEYLKEVERRSTKITNISQSKDDPLGTKLTKQVTAAAHNFAIDRPRITGVLSDAANFMFGVTEELKRSATDPNEKDIGKRLVGSFIHAEDAVIEKSATGARMWATGSDLYNPFTKEKIGSLPDLNVDPALATVVGGVSAGIVTGAFTDKGLNKVSKFKIPPNNLQPALVTNNTVLGQSVNTVLKNEDLVKTSFQYSDVSVTKTLNKLPPSVADVQIARKFKGNSAFVEQISAKTSRMKDLINQTADKRGWTDLSNYKGGDNYITTPKGEKFRYMWKDGRYSWRSMTSEGKRALKRLTGEGADLKSIEPLFRKHFNPTQAKEASALYIDTQRVVNNKIRTAITAYNKTVPASKHLSLEHIFDVKFYDNIKKDVPAFSGRGANELGNITALNKVENMRTGALNRKVDTWDAFLDTIRKDKGFPDYDKVISQFIYEDVGNVVANFTKKDWDEFIGQFLTRQGDTAQEIIIEMARKRN